MQNTLRREKWSQEPRCDSSLINKLYKLTRPAPFISDEVNSFTRINRNFFKPPVSEEVKDMVRSNFTREIEFYQFCKQRLYKQLRALKLTKSVPSLGSNSL